MFFLLCKKILLVSLFLLKIQKNLDFDKFILIYNHLITSFLHFIQRKFDFTILHMIKTI